nr:PIN domain-containing protein [uncultured Albidiferax sp.]
MICFFDTNILVYSVDGREPQKQKAALTLYAHTVVDGSFAISTQVLAEFYNATVKGKKPLLQRDEARLQVQTLARQRVVPTTAAMVGAATGHAERYQLQWWDAMVLEAALSVGASTLYSEDFQHGQRFGGVTVVNPFLG